MSESPGAYWKARAVEAEAEVTRQREELEDRTNQVRALEEFARLSIETEDQLRQALGRHHVADMRAECDRLRKELNEATKSTGGWREYVLRQQEKVEAERDRLVEQNREAVLLVARLRETLERANAAFMRGDPDEAYAAVRSVIGRRALEGTSDE